MLRSRWTASAPLPPEMGMTARLRTFADGGGVFENFGFVRGYYEGEGVRASLHDYVARKLCPVPGDGPGNRFTAAKFDLLLPAEAPSDYMMLDHLVRMYELMLPPWEASAFAQITLRFPRASNFHVPWERARDFARSELVGARQLPVLAVLHTPSAAGSANPPHVHLIAFPRKLGLFGFAEFDRELPTDIGNRKMHSAWLQHRAEQDAAEHRPDPASAAPCGCGWRTATFGRG